MSFLKKPIVLASIKYILLLLFFFLLCGLSFSLLYFEKIKGPEFVALVIASMLSCLIVNFINDIQEVSIGGNILRLKDINNRSETLLKNMQVEYYKMRLDMAFAPTGFWDAGGNSVYESRSKFYEVIQEIKNEGLLNNSILSQKIEMQLAKTLQHQLEDIHRIGNVLDVNPFSGKHDPLEIRSLISEEVVTKTVKTNNELYRDKDTAKDTILRRITIYENLLTAKKWIK